ncbi:Amylopullulanase [Thermoflexales bacterium]|nr:Amylopullulanase [Thermoflexales bacterium]
MTRHHLKLLAVIVISLLSFILITLPTVGRPLPPLRPHTPVVVDGVRDAGYTLLATDPVSDLANPGPGNWTGTAWSDLSNLYVADDGTYLYVYIDLPQYSQSGSSGSIGLALDTGSGGGSGEPWGNAITFAYTSTHNNVGLTPTITTTSILPNIIVRGNLPGMSGQTDSNNGWTELRQWNGSAWTGAGNNWGGISAGQQVGTNIAYANNQGVEIRLSYAQLGITAGQLVHLQFFGTQTNSTKGAYDTLPSDDQSTGWDDATTQRRLASLGSGAPIDPTPTPSPTPTGLPPQNCGTTATGDNAITTAGVYHLDTDGNYRTPLGDLQMGQTATVKLRTCLNDVQTVQALVWKTGAGANPSYIYTATLVETDPVNHYAYWAMAVPAPEVVIDQWYQFQIVDGTRTGYYHPIAGNTGPGVWSETRIDPSWKLGTVTPPPSDFAVPSWMKDAVIYQIFPDRFRNGNPSNDPPAYTANVQIYGPNTCNGYPHGRGSGPACVVDGRNWSDSLLIPSYGLDFYGGDLQGIINKINEGYFNDLGVNTLYLNPVFNASSNHGYDTNDYYNIRPYFGNNAKFDELITAANNHNLRIILDAVFNHAGSDSKYIDGYGRNRWPADTGACEGTTPYRSWFTAGGSGSGCTDDWKWKGWYGYETIPEFQEIDAVKDFFYRGSSPQSPSGISVAQYWIDKGIAGWRYDVAQDITLPFFHEMNQYIKHTYADTETLMLGEVTGGCDWGLYQNYVKEGYLDSAMNYCFRDWAVSFANGNAPSSFNSSFTAFRARFPNNAWHAMMNLISSHDSPRALNMMSGDTSRLKLIALLQMTLPGAPSVYYGDEVALPGGGDPDNRRTYPWADTGGSPDTAMYAHFKQVIGLRGAHSALRGGDFKTLLVDDANRLYSYLRWDTTESIVVALNNGDSARSNVVIPIAPTLSNGVVLTDVLNGGTYTVVDGNITVSNINSRWGVILVAGPINPPTLVAPLTIESSGPVTGTLGYMQSFSTQVEPVSVTLPITYVWQAGDQAPVIHSVSMRNDAASFTWLTTGIKVVTVTATNAGGTVTATHTISITTLPPLPIMPSAIAVTGSPTGTSSTQYTFNASVDPISVTLPITYVWQATDQSVVTHAGINDRSDAVNFVWPTAGVKVITVTATNAGGAVTDTHTITITALLIPPVAPSAIAVTGSLTGTSSTQYTFNASVDPISVTLPLTYTWQASDQANVTHTMVNDRTDAVNFVWSTTGTKIITTTATNMAGTVTTTHVITITALTMPVAPSAVNITGPLSGEIDRDYVFTATVSPITTTLPLTFTWSYELGTLTDGVIYPNVNGLVQPHMIKWPLTGTYAITVTASNEAGTAVSVYHFTVKPTWRVYLPLILR